MTKCLFVAENGMIGFETYFETVGHGMKHYEVEKGLFSPQITKRSKAATKRGKPEEP